MLQDDQAAIRRLPYAVAFSFDESACQTAILCRIWKQNSLSAGCLLLVKTNMLKKYLHKAPDLTQEFFANRYFSLTIWWRGPLIRSIELGPGAVPPRGVQAVARYSCRVAESMAFYERGEKVTWPEPPLDWSVISSDFQKKVLKTLMKKIGFGRTASYEDLAEMSGSAGAARAVGNVMSNNPWPVIVPCHRVLGRRGPGGFSSGIEMKMTLLSLEGISDGRLAEMVAKAGASA
jgi:methylated-DNA-[protein]-cysteine S-methyltransferase